MEPQRDGEMEPQEALLWAQYHGWLYNLKTSARFGSWYHMDQFIMNGWFFGSVKGTEEEDLQAAVPYAVVIAVCTVVITTAFWLWYFKRDKAAMRLKEMLENRERKKKENAERKEEHRYSPFLSEHDRKRLSDKKHVFDYRYSKQQLEHLEQHGFVVIRGFVKQNVCNTLRSEVERKAEKLAGIKRDNPATWLSSQYSPYHFIDIWHTKTQYELRQSTMLYSVFAQLYKTHELGASLGKWFIFAKQIRTVPRLTSERTPLYFCIHTDRVQFIPPVKTLVDKNQVAESHLEILGEHCEITMGDNAATTPIPNRDEPEEVDLVEFDFSQTRRHTPLHCNMNLWDLSTTRWEGVVCVEDTGDFVCLPGFHKHGTLSKYRERYERGAFSEGEPQGPPAKHTRLHVLLDEEAKDDLIKTNLSKGDLVIWNSRIPHATSQRMPHSWTTFAFFNFYPRGNTFAERYCKEVARCCKAQEKPQVHWSGRRTSGKHRRWERVHTSGRTEKSFSNTPPRTADGLSVLGRKVFGLEGWQNTSTS